MPTFNIISFDILLVNVALFMVLYEYEHIIIRAKNGITYCVTALLCISLLLYARKSKAKKRKTLKNRSNIKAEII